MSKLTVMGKLNIFANLVVFTLLLADRVPSLHDFAGGLGNQTKTASAPPKDKSILGRWATLSVATPPRKVEKHYVSLPRTLKVTLLVCDPRPGA